MKYVGAAIMLVIPGALVLWLTRDVRKQKREAKERTRLLAAWITELQDHSREFHDGRK